jgi:hypothetical protein
MFPKQKDLLLDNENNSNGTVITRDTSLKRRSITTPSRRRRIIYDVTRYTAKCYLQDGLERYIVARNASTSIQSLVRRHIAQTRFHSLLQCLIEASTKIQRQFRSYLARRILYQVLKSKDTQKRNRAATTITSHYRKLRAINAVRCLKLEQAKHSEAHRLASRVQSFIRGAIARKRVEEMRLVQLHKECGAIVIQSFVRTIFARHTYIKSRYREKMEPRVTLIQRVFRGHLAVLQHKKLLQSTVFVQNWWRHCLRYPRSTIRAEIEDIQSVSSNCPRSVTSYEDSETCSQEDQHLFLSTNKSEPDVSISHILDTGHLSESGEYVDSVNPVSNRDSDEITAEIQHDYQSIHLDLLETKNAIVIQRFIRNYLEKARLILLHKVVKDSIDHAIDHIANQRWQQVLYSCATKINAGARGYLSRKSVSKIICFTWA